MTVGGHVPSLTAQFLPIVNIAGDSRLFPNECFELCAGSLVALPARLCTDIALFIED